MLNSRTKYLLMLLATFSLAACGSDATGPDDPDPPATDPDYVESPAQEARAVWLSRYDWSTATDLTDMIDSAAAANFNLVYFQARGRSDAYYRSSLEPWAHRGAGTGFVLGQDPGWDPLYTALSRARARGLQLHVWLNAFIGWCGTEPIPETTPRHVLLAHPEWKMVNAQGSSANSENCTFLTPGDPGVRRHLARVAADIVRNYAVDGIHLDYIRYPDATMSYDAQSQADYNARKATNPSYTYDQYRRDMVTATVREVRDSMKAARAGTVLSAAVWGIYDSNLPSGWSGVSTGYGTRFQDSRGWLQQGIIDAIVPMAYWGIKASYGSRLDFAWLSDNFAANRFGRHVYMGMGVPAPAENFCNDCDIVKEIYQSRRAKAQGIAVFRARLMNPALWQKLREGPFKTKVPVPTPPASNILGQ